MQMKIIIIRMIFMLNIHAIKERARNPKIAIQLALSAVILLPLKSVLLMFEMHLSASSIADIVINPKQLLLELFELATTFAAMT